MNIVDQILDDAPPQTDEERLQELIEALDQAPGQAPALGQRLILNPLQSDFVTSADRGYGEVLYSGSVGGGKSLSLCAGILRYVAVPGSTVLLCRLNLSDLKKSTLRTLLRPEPMLDGTTRQPLLPQQCIDAYNKCEGVITLTNGSQIICSGAQDPEKIRSITVNAAFIDEVSQLEQEQYLAITQRARVPGQLGNCTVSATNPGTRAHWLWHRFLEDLAKARGQGMNAITASAYTNPFLSRTYIQSLERLPEPERSRMLLGLWTETEENVFKGAGACIGDVVVDGSRQWLIGQDYGGGSGPAGMVLLGIDENGVVSCAKEYCVQGPSHSQVLGWMEQYRALTSSTVVYDSANAALKQDMENRGWTCVPSIKDIDGSVSMVNGLIGDKKIVIDRSCTVLLKQLQAARRDPLTGKALKLKDWDVVDAFRYGVCAITARPKQKSLFFIPD